MSSPAEGVSEQGVNVRGRNSQETGEDWTVRNWLYDNALFARCYHGVEERLEMLVCMIV
jgi:hypothetical protein